MTVEQDTMTDPFAPPESPDSHSLAFLPIAAAASALAAAFLACCCGVLGMLVAWILPTTFLIWGAVLLTNPAHSDELREIGMKTAIWGGVGLLAIPVSFFGVTCLALLFLIPADIGQVVLDTIMSA